MKQRLLILSLSFVLLVLLLAFLASSLDGFGRYEAGRESTKNNFVSDSDSGKSWSETDRREKIAVVCYLGFLFLLWLIVVVDRLIKRFKPKPGSDAYGPLYKGRHDEIEKGIQKEDPFFTTDVFLSQFKIAFHAIQNAWQNQTIDPIQAFVSDGIYERFSLQIKEQIDLGYRNFMDKIEIHDTLFADLQTDTFFQTLTVQVNASAICYRVDKDSDRYISGSKSRKKFTEYWSFIRRFGVQTMKGMGQLIEGRCPNCHTDLQMSRSSQCASCGAVLRSGEYGWVLAEISLASEWVHGITVNPPSVLTYQTVDPGFNLQHVEDRASVIFWRKVMADRIAKIDPLIKMSLDEFSHSYQSELNLSNNHERIYFDDCSVGSVECLGVVPRESRDYLLVEIKWAGNRIRVGTDGKQNNLGWGRLKTLFVLMRHKGIQTNLSHAIQSAHCLSCGAAEKEMASHNCLYCGETLNSGAHDWVLAEVGDLHSTWAIDWKQSLGKVDQSIRSSISNLDLMEWVIKIVAADQLLKPEEREAIEKLCSKLGLNDSYAKDLIETVTQRHGESMQPPDYATGRKWLAIIADLAVADGEISAEEKAVLLELGKYVEWTEADVNLLLNKHRIRESVT